MRRWWLSLIALASAAASAVPVWRWVDDNGVIHYSDRPVPGAERIELSPAQSVPLGASRSSTTARQPSRSQQPAAREIAPYRRLEVTQPADQETLWNIAGTLEVRVEVEPPLLPSHRLDVALDGQRKNLASTTTALTVPEVFRGVHTLAAVVVDANGDVVQRSSAVTFVVQQTSILNPNNPNAPARARGN